MPDARNLPTDYAKYALRAKTSSKKTALSLLNRFSFRYRLAVDFQGLVAPNVGRTLLGYNVITKVFLAYTAYEILVKAARLLKLHSVQSVDINTIFDNQLAKKLRSNEKLRNFMLTYPHKSQELREKLKLFFQGSTHDIVCVAYALRSVFAHGELTASVIGTETKAKREMFKELADVLLSYCDKKFTDCLVRL